MLIRETVIQEAWGVENGLITGVKLCGLESLNGHKYPREILEAARPLYENAPVFIGHNDHREYEQHLGIVHPLHVDPTGLVGSVELKPKHPLYESILWDVQHKSKQIGFSHVVEGDIVDNVVRSIDVVHSVDLVVGPATTKSLVESVQIKAVQDTDGWKSLLEEFKGQRTILEQVLAELIRGQAKEATRPPMARVPEAPPAVHRQIDLKDWCQNLLYKRFPSQSGRGWLV